MAAQVELLGDIPEPSQAHPAQPHTQFEFGEQSLDLVPFPFRASIRWGLRQLPRHLPGRFMPVHEELPKRCWGTLLLHRATATLRLGRPINVPLVLPGHPVIAQRLTLRTTGDILDWVILELVARVAPMRLVASIDHRNVRLDVPLQQPGWNSPLP